MERKERIDMKQPAVAAFLLLLLPLRTFASEPGSVHAFAVNIVVFINETLIPLIFAFALVAFIWGMFRYFILGGGDEESRAKGKSLLFSAIGGFVMMIVIFAVVNLLASGLLTAMGVPNELILNLPQIAF